MTRASGSSSSYNTSSFPPQRSGREGRDRQVRTFNTEKAYIRKESEESDIGSDTEVEADKSTSDRPRSYKAEPDKKEESSSESETEDKSVQYSRFSSRNVDPHLQDEVDEKESEQTYDMLYTRHTYGKSTSGINIEDAPAEESDAESDKGSDKD